MSNTINIMSKSGLERAHRLTGPTHCTLSPGYFLGQDLPRRDPYVQKAGTACLALLRKNP